MRMRCTRSGGSDSGRSSAHPIRRATTGTRRQSPALAPLAPLPPLPSSCSCSEARPRQRRPRSATSSSAISLGRTTRATTPTGSSDGFPLHPAARPLPGAKVAIGGSVLRLAGPRPRRPASMQSKRRPRRRAKQARRMDRGGGAGHRPTCRPTGWRAGAPAGAGRAAPRCCSTPRQPTTACAAPTATRRCSMSRPASACGPTRSRSCWRAALDARAAAAGAGARGPARLGRRYTRRCANSA